MNEDKSMNFNLILVAKIRAAHGIKGEVKMTVFLDSPQDLTSLSPLYNAQAQIQEQIKVKKVLDRSVIAQIGKINSRSDAEKLVGQEFYIKKEQLPKLGQEEFYYSDLVGLKALTHDMIHYGDVVSMNNFGAGDVMEIRIISTQKTEYIAFTASTIIRVDIEAGFIVIELPEYI